ncbi:DinB family protein [Fuerstiella marisgermanici]|uniref:Metal-dependent hydrolase YfiT n=1 Tax=Fuerstiella marisgermanici TaxID=1891926 RepID=A0A1P8WGD1_9PLAN|nr:DinB family protein [Fuerstiella marisgermanici]APZ93118.1 Putative metal-dependent hydrolase YfiT [Fuerstiella marisgermanici]
MKDIPTLLSEYKAGAELLTAKVGSLPDDVVDKVPVPGKWSIRQVVCHIADFEIVAADRMKRILSDDNPTLLDGDPDLFVDALQYGHRQMESELNLISAIRTSVAQILSACDVEVFQRTGVHSTDGPMTLETVLERSVNHIPHHLAFIDEKLAALARLP